MESTVSDFSVRLGESADAGSSEAEAKRFLLAAQSAIAIAAEMHTSGIRGIRSHRAGRARHQDKIGEKPEERCAYRDWQTTQPTIVFARLSAILVRPDAF
jgi:hypothetical protein